MTNTMANIGALGPFKLVFNMLSSQNHAFDVLSGAKRHQDLPLGEASGESHVSHSTMLTHAVRKSSLYFGVLLWF